MSLKDGDDAALIERALTELREAWALAGEGWRDAAHADYDRDHLDRIEWRARHAMQSLIELSTLCADAMRKCE